VTPAVLGATLFAVGCAMFAIAFVAARGGLQVPIAALSSPAASGPPSGAAAASAGPPASLPVASAPPSLGPNASTPPPPTGSPVPVLPSTAPTPGSIDPLTALPPCPDQPGCYEYVIRRGDTVSGVASRYLLPVLTVLALNPELDNARTVVVGQILYLGRDPFARLEPCPDAADCALYVVRPGDVLSAIANRFGLTVDAILAFNPSVSDPNGIYSHQVLRLPHAG